ncbi:hypothetical protein C8F01DRAFT_3860 [Mycena amicta]|nr:hypothetical protein C8F01DRAFT_3860 [Mycena amicta]
MIHVASACAADRALLSEVEDEIQRLEVHLTSLRKEREDISARLANYKYPVLTLPNEITGEIFLHYLPPYPSIPLLVGPQSPTKLLGICRLWREIALHCPLLWRAIMLDRAQDLDLVQTWLQRSGSSSLVLHLNFRKYGPEIPQAGEMLKAVLLHRSRWEHVTFMGHPSQISLISGPAPCLFHLEVVSWQNEVSPTENIALCDVPRLRSVCLWDVGCSVGALPWAQLTCLILLHVHFADCAPIVEHATNLLQCKLFLRTFDAEAVNILLPRLEILVLQTDDEDLELNAAGSFLAQFILPSLRRLELAYALFGAEAVVPQIRSFMTESKCHLQRLRITGGFAACRPGVEACQVAFPALDIDNCRADEYDTNTWMSEEYWESISASFAQEEEEYDSYDSENSN